MEPDELTLLREASRRRQHAVEFGCGASSLLLLRSGVGALDSVDSQPAWVECVSRELDAAAALRTGRLRMHCVDIGPTRKWSHPLDDESKAGWPQYAQALPPFFDVVGRTGSLAILTQRQDLDRAGIETLLREYVNDPA
ncbi:MAG TPA: hypothetical protein VLL30_24170 [Reyranella sp.]|nr:hypothetical protein [Reyranella sp.]